ncbi:hypothetical protein AMATHDRAFT_49570 [Amanita thiersii Skay4041]|uniref:C2H2-type domain-containing protein n=1 Tax=Amanita thiersii Skay4041 TaxID=703135 RepID=A0A2A9NGD4_9AGAR|nr:hypothetical protein AMATHDRAFT_49570 [Amanita thiersii Skay4041]
MHPPYYVDANGYPVFDQSINPNLLSAQWNGAFDNSTLQLAVPPLETNPINSNGNLYQMEQSPTESPLSPEGMYPNMSNTLRQTVAPIVTEGIDFQGMHYPSPTSSATPETPNNPWFANYPGPSESSYVTSPTEVHISPLDQLVVNNVVGTENIRESASKRRTNKGKFFCPVASCAGSFTCRHNWEYHINGHLGHKPYACRLGCTYRASARPSVQRHEKNETCRKRQSKEVRV